MSDMYYEIKISNRKMHGNGNERKWAKSVFNSTGHRFVCGNAGRLGWVGNSSNKKSTGQNAKAITHPRFRNMSNSVCGTGSGEKNAISINSKKNKGRTNAVSERTQQRKMHAWAKEPTVCGGGKKWQADEWIWETAPKGHAYLEKRIEHCRASVGYELNKNIN